MILDFYKYQGTGNDFVIVDNRAKTFPKNNLALISKLCDRHFGIGADGVMLLEEHETSDFRMIYYNADGTQTMCGNGARCMVAFAKYLGIIDSKTNFTAYDGEHYAEVSEEGIVSLHMIDVDKVKIHDDYVFADTGTQHHVEIVEDLTNFPVFEKGKKIRYDVYGAPGSNVNFVQQLDAKTFRVRTYEKGVEDETLACGTGVTAVALAMHATHKTTEKNITLPVEGGILSVSFEEHNGTYSNIYLSGPATFVFKGQISI
ncbi:diaminopimelate epimerase [uncultured Tenacibaculum sp.]|uniref:diaminopimelate epimerase n=1 Tax=uncultured Tenacibaculum sp. TaxID=174713 RepID=UPI0026352576|nr:diaminopimelate epimerase [uncultured Tenacibaculum sp.]